MLLLTLICLLVLFIFLGMEIAWAIAVACLAYMVLADLGGDGIPYELLPQQMLDGVDTFSLIAIPLFIFAGELMSVTGVTERLVRFALAYMGHIRGGLANVAVTTNFILSGVSGSAIADAAATGTVTIPEMKKRGYPTDFACAVVAASSTVGPIIPPSISFVLIASIANLSVGQLFLAGVVPGILMTVSMLALTYFISRQKGYPVEPRASWTERFDALGRAALPLAAPLLIMRSITSGIATPTEAAAVLVLYVLGLGVFVYRTMSWRVVIQCAANAMLLSSIIMLTVGAAQMFSWLAVYEQFGEILTHSMLQISRDVNVLLLIFNVLLLLLGTFMEPLPVMLVLVPITFPMFEALGVNQIQLAVVMVINLILGLLTPPVGLILNVVAVIGRTEVAAVFRASIPYLIILVAVMMLVTYVPALSLWLPHWLMPVQG
ncbi:MAG: TRAP transporter large permease [Alphaproteobacteria bacterium]|nr:TRAP transporter large permease [Alphaproteobacteria bacterium]